MTRHEFYLTWLIHVDPQHFATINGIANPIQFRGDHTLLTDEFGRAKEVQS